jgi:hypothetical protein
MNSQQLELALRQQRLVARSAELRARLGDDLLPCQRLLGRVDEVRRLMEDSWNWLRRHPEVPAGLAIGVALLRPRRALRWAWRWGRRAWLGWQLYQRANRQVQAQGFGRRLPTKR